MASFLDAGGGIESDFDLMELAQQDFEASARGMLDGVTMRAAFDMMTMFRPSALDFVTVRDLMDAFDTGMLATRLIATDYMRVQGEGRLQIYHRTSRKTRGPLRFRGACGSYLTESTYVFLDLTSGSGSRQVIMFLSAI